VASETSRWHEPADILKSPGRRWGPSLGLLLVMLGIGVRVNRVQRLSILGTGDVTGVWNLSVSKAIILLAALLLLAYVLLRPRQRVLRIDLPLKFLGAFVIWEMLSYFWALYPELAVSQTLRSAFKLSIYVLIITFTLTWDDLHRWGHLLMYMSLGFFLTAAYEGLMIGFYAVPSGPEHRLYVGILGRWSVLLVPFNLHYSSWGRSRSETILGICGLLANLGTIYIVARRAPLLAITIQLFIYLVLIGYRRKSLLAAVLLVFSLIPILVLSNPRFIQRVELTFAALQSGGELLNELDSARIIQFSAGIEAAKGYWLIGMGSGSFIRWVTEVYGFFKELVLHNLILELIVELGVIGLLLYTCFVGFGLSRMWRCWQFFMRRRAFRQASLMAAMFCSLVGVLIYAQLQPILHESLIYLLVALGSVAFELLRRAQREEGSPAVAGAQP